MRIRRGEVTKNALTTIASKHPLAKITPRQEIKTRHEKAKKKVFNGLLYTFMRKSGQPAMSTARSDFIQCLVNLMLAIASMAPLGYVALMDSIPAPLRVLAAAGMALCAISLLQIARAWPHIVLDDVVERPEQA